MIQPGIYEHYKGQQYRVHFIAKWEENMQPVVVYEALYESPEGPYFVRLLAVFLEEVVIDGVKKPRFRFIGEDVLKSGKTSKVLRTF